MPPAASVSPLDRDKASGLDPGKMRSENSRFLSSHFSVFERIGKKSDVGNKQEIPPMAGASPRDLQVASQKNMKYAYDAAGQLVKEDDKVYSCIQAQTMRKRLEDIWPIKMNLCADQGGKA